MALRRKVFRIEEMQAASARASAAEATPLGEQHHQMLAELIALRSLIERRSETATESSSGADKPLEADGLRQLGPQQWGLRQLKDETDIIHRAIVSTKEEIAALHVSGLNTPESRRASRELDAVAGGAERAIQQILAAAEDIDEAANTLSAATKGEQERALAHDIRDQVVRIFEACNFQDLAGQRIAKVLETLKFVEDRIARMMDIWGGIDAFKHYTAAALAARGPEPVLLNGPKLEGEVGHASQEDIDALFSR